MQPPKIPNVCSNLEPTRETALLVHIQMDRYRGLSLAKISKKYKRPVAEIEALLQTTKVVPAPGW